MHLGRRSNKPPPVIILIWNLNPTFVEICSYLFVLDENGDSTL